MPLNHFDQMLQGADLFVLYGQLLTPKQRRLFEDYYFADFSLNEIAENLQISKQAVSDQLRRALNKLERYEESLGLRELTKRQEKARRKLNAMLHSVSKENSLYSALEELQEILQ